MEPQLTPARDPKLWQQAKAQAHFKSGLLAYLLVNTILWAVWYITSPGQLYPLPWPAWSTIFWGLGVFFEGVKTYAGWSKEGLAEREYDKLSRPR